MEKFDINQLQNKWFGSEDYINRLQIELKKNTNRAYQKNKEFFDKLKIEFNQKKINEIYVYGFSFSQVDQFYLKKICNNTL